MKNIILILSSVFFIYSCSSLTKEDCQKFDLIQKGQKDASHGEPSQFQEYQNQCGSHGITLSSKRYDQGYQAGLKEYCNYENGLKHGLDGKEPFTACRSLTTNFYRGYEKGFQEFEAKKEDTRKNDLRKKTKNEIITRFGGKECTSSFDCIRQGQCTINNKCSQDNSSCRYDSDCKIKGSCQKESSYVASLNEWVEVRVCEY